jgi:hypothetical protein
VGADPFATMRAAFTKADPSTQLRSWQLQQLEARVMVLEQQAKSAATATSKTQREVGPKELTVEGWCGCKWTGERAGIASSLTHCGVGDGRLRQCGCAILPPSVGAGNCHVGFAVHSLGTLSVCGMFRVLPHEHLVSCVLVTKHAHSLLIP